jgi:hypothetical protein
MRKLITTMLLLCVTSIAQSASFDLAYTVRKGDIDNDGRLDLYPDYRPRITPLMLDDITIPIPMTRRDVGQFALRQLPSGSFERVPLSTAQQAAAKVWEGTSLLAIASDLNADEYMDLFIENVASAIPGARDVFVFAPDASGAQPIAIKNRDASVTNFVRDLNAAAGNPNYFDSGWVYVRTVVQVYSLPTYACGIYEYADPTEIMPSPDDPWGPTVQPWGGLPNGGVGCVYVGRTNWGLPIDEYRFDASSFSQQAIDVFYALRHDFQRTGSFTMEPDRAKIVQQAMSSLFGVSFDSSPNSTVPPELLPDVKVDPKLERTGKGGLLRQVGMVTRVVNIIIGCLIWNDTAEDDEVFNVFFHYSYRSQAASLAGGLWAGTYVTDEPLVSGPTALQLYAMPPKDANDTPPDAWYSAQVDSTIPRIRRREVVLTFSQPYYPATVTRTGGGEAIRLLARTNGGVAGPFRLPPFP